MYRLGDLIVGHDSYKLQSLGKDSLVTKCYKMVRKSEIRSETKVCVRETIRYT